jgi:tripartite-type tricarboxylate transporter receptor subunit TctC
MRIPLIRCAMLPIAFAGLVAAGASWSESYPVKPVRIVLQGPPASGPDVIMRPIARSLSESLGQPVIVDNRPGASGVIAAQAVASSPPDGYTLFLGNSSSFSIAPFLLKKRPYDPVLDFTPVTLVVTAPLIVTSHPALPVTSIQELIGLAKAKPGQILFASPGTGTIQHLTMELFTLAAGITMVHVPYKGGTPAVIDTVSGQVNVAITAVPAVLSQIKASRLRALAVTGSKRLATAPDIPTVAESALPGFDCVQWYGLFVPKSTPAAVVEKLYREVRKATQGPGVHSAVVQEGVELDVNGPQALAEFLRLDMAKWQKVIRESNIPLD